MGQCPRYLRSRRLIDWSLRRRSRGDVVVVLVVSAGSTPTLVVVLHAIHATVATTLLD